MLGLYVRTERTALYHASATAELFPERVTPLTTHRDCPFFLKHPTSTMLPLICFLIWFTTDLLLYLKLQACLRSSFLVCSSMQSKLRAQLSWQPLCTPRGVPERRDSGYKRQIKNSVLSQTHFNNYHMYPRIQLPSTPMSSKLEVLATSTHQELTIAYTNLTLHALSQFVWGYNSYKE